MARAKELLSSLPLSNTTDDVDIAWRKWVKEFVTIMEECIPKKLVPIESLLNKIYHLKIPSIFCWLISYLMNHFQQVVFKRCSSTWLPVRSGVPQGSILGPLLFLLYMNDISDVPLSPGTKLFLFADDILLVKPIESDSEFCNFQKEIDAISNWTVANYLPNMVQTH